LTNDLSSYVGVGITSDRKSLVTSRSDTRVEIWVGDAAGTRGVDVTPSIESVEIVTQLAWAADRVVYGSTLNRVPSIASVTPGHAPVDIVTNAALPAVTSDGRTVVFFNTNEDARGLWKIDATSGGRAVMIEKGNALWRIVTPDDRSVVFLCQRVRDCRVPGSSRSREASRRKSSMRSRPLPAWTSRGMAGRLLFQTSDPQNRFKLVVCELPTCANRISLDPPANFAYGALRFTPDERGIAYVTGSNIWSQPLEEGPPRQDTDFPDVWRIANFAWSRDGKRLAVAPATVTNDVVLLKAKHD
jgi:hypothetical protein